MDNKKLMKLAVETNELIGYIIKAQLDNKKADQDVILQKDVITKKRIDRAKLRLIKKLLVDIYSIVDKLDDATYKDIVRLQLLIDESIL